MKAISWRVQLRAVAVCYAAVFSIAALLVYVRYMQYVNHPADAVSSGGMYAGGDLLLEFFICGLFLIPTFLLVLVIRQSEPASLRYSQALLGLSLTAPLCLGMFLIPAVNQGNGFLGQFCLYRLFATPFVIVGLAASWFLANFSRAKRLTRYAGLIEVGTFALLITLLLLSTRQVRG